MPPLQRISSHFPLLFLALLSAWCCQCQDADNFLDRSLSPPDPSPSPAPSLETPNPLKDPKVRRALIRALTRSLQNLGDDNDEVTEGRRSEGLVRVRGFIATTESNDVSLPTNTPSTQSTDDFLQDSILNEVDKHIQTAEFHRVPPEEVHVTSKVAPRPFSVDPISKTFKDSLSSPTEAGEENSLGAVETTVKPSTEDLRIEQHEIQSVEATNANADLRSRAVEEKIDAPKGNTVDIYRAPLIAAFTVHQDYLTGATRGVVPLLPASALSPSANSLPTSSLPQGQSPPLPLPNDELQDLVRQITTHPASSQSGRFPLLSREQIHQQELIERQRGPQQQSLVYLGQKPLDAATTRNRDAFSPEQQLLEQRLRRIRQLQELQHLQDRLQRLQQQFQVGL